MQRIEIDHDFSKPVDRVYAYLADHPNLGPLFGAKVTRVKAGDAEPNGVGSVRQLRIAVLPPFEETVTQAIPDELIAYRITKGSPLRGHHGEMHFSAQGTGSHLRYVIEFGAVIPGLDLIVAKVLQSSIKKNLHLVDEQA